MAKAPVSGRGNKATTRKDVAPRRSWRPIALAFGGLIVLLAIAALVLRNPPATTTTAAANGRAVAPFATDTTKGRSHVTSGTKVTYVTNPPAGGDHWPSTVTWGIQVNAPADESLMHNLEHGGVIFWYDPAKVDAASSEKLKTLTRTLQDSNFRLILTPRPGGIENGKAIAMTSWGYIMTLDSYDEGALRAFFNAHIGRGPECQNGNCPD